MANPNGNPQNLIRRAGPGRPKKDILPSRNELLEALTQRPGKMGDNKTLLADAMDRFHELACTSNSSASIEWLFNQLIGSPKSTIKLEVKDSDIFMAYAVCMSELEYTEEQAQELTTRVISKLKGEQ